MYCAAERSWRRGSAITSSRYCANDITRRLRVNERRISSPRDSRVVLTLVGWSAIRAGRYHSLRGDSDLARRRLRHAAGVVVVADGDGPLAGELVRAGGGARQLDAERELRPVEVGRLRRGLLRVRRGDPGRGSERELGRELGVDVVAGGGRDRDGRDHGFSGFRR